MCWSLSPVFVKKEEERHGLSNKNIWTHEGPSIGKKCGHMKVHEKKRDSHTLKRIYIERDHTKGVFISSTTIHKRAHLDLIV